MEHAMRCFMRLIKLLLGEDSIQHKFAYGSDLIILGVHCIISSSGICFRPSTDKILKWLKTIRQALDTGVLHAGEAQKLAGRLNWAASTLFSRFGRALLRPIFDQICKRNGSIDKHLRRALLWWEHVLTFEIAEERAWKSNEGHIFHVFCDARGNPPHVAAVVLARNQCWYTHMPIAEPLLGFFSVRRDNQIMGLELLGIALALSTFGELLRGRRVVFHCDNSGAEFAFRRGVAKAWDHCQLIQAMWTQVLRLHLQAPIFSILK